MVNFSGPVPSASACCCEITAHRRTRRPKVYQLASGMNNVPLKANVAGVGAVVVLSSLALLYVLFERETRHLASDYWTRCQ